MREPDFRSIRHDSFSLLIQRLPQQRIIGKFKETNLAGNLPGFMIPVDRERIGIVAAVTMQGPAISCSVRKEFEKILKRIIFRLKALFGSDGVHHFAKVHQFTARKYPALA